MITLPKWTLSGRRNLPPHRHKVLARATHRVGGGMRVFMLAKAGGWRRPRWWLVGGVGPDCWFQVGITTTDEAKARVWVQAVKAGTIRFADDGEVVT